MIKKKKNHVYENKILKCSLRTTWNYFDVQIHNTYNSYIHGNQLKLYNYIKYFGIWVPMRTFYE